MNPENVLFTVYMKQSAYLSHDVEIFSWIQLGLLENGLCEKTLENCIDFMKVPYFYLHVLLQSAGTDKYFKTWQTLCWNNAQL